VRADTSSGAVAGTPHRLTHLRQTLILATGLAALLTGTMAIWVAAELRITGPGWLAWLACALPPAAAGALCLARRRAASVAPAAVFGSCSVTAANAVLVPTGRSGLVLTASLLLLLSAGVAVVISAIATAILIGSPGGAFSHRRAAVWAAAGLVFAALSIPSPVYVTGGPIQTIFAGNTGGENAAAVCSLVLLALPLVVAGLSSARMAAVIAATWLPGAAAQPISWYVFLVRFLQLDAWYYVSWLAWLAIAVLMLAAARNGRSGASSQSPATPGASYLTGRR
jgi:hypothetical protein